MIALHCSVLDGKLLLWSEGREPGDIWELRRAFKAIGMSVPIRKPMLKELLAWLPHRGEERVPSSPLVENATVHGKLSVSVRLPHTDLEANCTFPNSPPMEGWQWSLSEVEMSLKGWLTKNIGLLHVVRNDRKKGS